MEKPLGIFAGVVSISLQQLLDRRFLPSHQKVRPQTFELTAPKLFQQFARRRVAGLLVDAPWPRGEAVDPGRKNIEIDSPCIACGSSFDASPFVDPNFYGRPPCHW